MRSIPLSPLDRDSFAPSAGVSSMQSAAAARPGCCIRDLLSNRRVSPDELARFVNDFLAESEPRKASNA